jgi:hypothetical protein
VNIKIPKKKKKNLRARGSKKYVRYGDGFKLHGRNTNQTVLCFGLLCDIGIINNSMINPTKKKKSM